MWRSGITAETAGRARHGWPTAMTGRAERIERVHLVFKTHLDIGFTDHAGAVRRQYHERFIPQALATAEHFWREDAARPMFVWTTGAWLIHDHLEVADPAGRRRLETAIERGLIRWHGLPFTTHSELMSPAVFRAGLSYSAELDARFGVTTRAAKMTDVPGHTLGIVPLMAEAGLRFLHLGVNSASPVPGLPDLFRWRAPDGAEIVVMYQPSYGALHLPEGMADALSFAHTHDNIGPQSVAQTVEAWRATQAAAPGAKIRATTLEDYAGLLWERRDALPVWDGEIGDSWIHGAASDPVKLARFRTLQRVHDDLPEQTPGRLALGRQLAMVAEHTWGVDIKTYLRDRSVWSAAALARARTDDYRFRFCEQSWAEQRGFLDAGVAALETDARSKAQAALAELATPARLQGPAPDHVGGWRIDVDDTTGDLLALTLPDGRRLAGAPLMSFRHHSFDAADLDRHLDTYLTDRPEWAYLDHAKPGLEDAPEARSARIAPLLQGVAGDTDTLEITASCPADAVAEIGAPAAVRWRLTARDDGLEIALVLEGKRANRMPEAGFWEIVPEGARNWRLEKMGLWIDPADCPPGGGSLHAVCAAEAGTPCGRLRLVPLDTALLGPAGRDFMTYGPRHDPWDAGARLVVYNNKWGTNFPMWWEGDLTSRVIVRL